MTTRKRREVFGVLVLLVGGMLLGQLAVKRMVAKVEELDRRIAQRQEELAQKQREQENLKIYVDKWDEIKGFADEPVGERETKLTAYLQNLTKERDFDYTDLGQPTGRTMEENPQFQILSSKLTFNTDLEDLSELVEFLAELDTSGWLLRVDEIRISRQTRLYEGLRRYEALLPGSIRNGGLGGNSLGLRVEMTVSTVSALPMSEDDSEVRMP